MKAIPVATAYAIGMGVTIAGALIVDAAFFKERCGTLRIVCAILVVAAIWALRFAPARWAVRFGRRKT